MKLWPFSRSNEQKASAAGHVVSAWFTGQPVWTDRDYENLARESYVQNAVAYRCIRLIAGSAACAPWMLQDKSGKELESHPLLDLLNRPNPMNGGAALFEAVYAYLLIAGNSYLEAVGPKSTKAPPRELWTLRPDRMKVIAGEMGLPSGYEYEANGQRFRWDVDVLKGKSPILHLKEFNPTDDWYGLSRIEPGAYGVDRHNAASGHNKALLDNGARPSGALVFEPVKTGENAMQTAPKEVIDAAKEDMRGHIGPANAGRHFVFGGNVKWLPFGVTPKDMDFSGGKDDAARDICLAMGVPHILIVPGSSTYNNVREAKLELWEDTILPLTDRVIDELNNWLVPMFGDGLKLSLDLDGVSALEPRRESKRKSTLELVDAGILDSDEGREALQYEPRPASSVKKVDSAVLTALVNAVDVAGFEPLVRYMKSVGLYDPSMTMDQVIVAATAHMSDDLENEEDLIAPNAGNGENADDGSDAV